MTTTTTDPTTRTLDVPGATLTYDVRRIAESTVVTYDPRGVERSTKSDPPSESTPDEHADEAAQAEVGYGVYAVGRCILRA